jgi:hypothetical protein
MSSCFRFRGRVQLPDLRIELVQQPQQLLPPPDLPPTTRARIRPPSARTIACSPSLLSPPARPSAGRCKTSSLPRSRAPTSEPSPPPLPFPILLSSGSAGDNHSLSSTSSASFPATLGQVSNQVYRFLGADDFIESRHLRRVVSKSHSRNHALFRSL